MQIVIFFVLMFLSIAYFSHEVYCRYRYTRLGKPEDRNSNPRLRWIRFFKSVFFQKKINKYPLLGLFHGFIMWGFVILLLSTIDMAGLGLFQTGIPFFTNNVGYLFIRDAFIFLVLVGIFGFLIRRLFFRPDWLHNSFKAYAILLLIFIIVLSELLYYTFLATLEETYISATPWLVLSFSKLITFNNNTSIYMLIEMSWWVHFLTIFFFFYIIPRTKHLHFVFAPFNVYWSSLKPLGSIKTIDLDQQNQQCFCLKSFEDFSQKQLFDAFSCVLCGRCHGFCPSERSGERLKPKKINGRLRTQMEQDGPKLLKTHSQRADIKVNKENQVSLQNKMVGGMFHHDFIWSCTTCGSCNEVCPISIDHLGKLIDMRRAIVSEKKDVSTEIKQVFSGVEKHGNPLGKVRGQHDETSWIKALGIPTLAQNPDAKYLFYIGCQATFDKSSQKSVISFAKILQIAGIDFAVLSDKEWCCGENVRRMGNEILFQKTVNKNIAYWAQLGIKKIITACPHCFNTFKNEYPQFGGHYEVIPHSVFLADLWRQGKLKSSQRRQPTKITYHDPCYLGRYNQVYQEQREMLSNIPGLSFVEMPRAREDSFCCGAGGGRFWTRKNDKNPISIYRVREAQATEAERVITSCPYCYTIFMERMDDTDFGKKMITQDIAELVESYL